MSLFPRPARPTTIGARPWPSFHHNVTPQHSYWRTATIPLTRVGQSLVSASSVATVTVGPSGTGTKWYPNTATFTTSTGVNDTTSTVVLYFQIVGAGTPVIGQTGAGGAYTTGFAVPTMTPGDVLVARWTGAKPGDVAQLIVSGTQDVLVDY